MLNGEEPAPVVDFTREMVVAVFMGKQATGGFDIEIESIQKAGEQLQVKTSTKTPDSGSMVIQMLTAPTHWVAVPKSPLPVVF